MAGSKKGSQSPVTPEATGAAAAASPNSKSGSPGSNNSGGAGTTENLLPGDHWVEREEDQDSLADDEDFTESTASISSSVLAYRTIHGRTYHSERGKADYWGSNDAQQIESMDLNHHVLTLAINDKLHLAPIPNDITKAVDIGTGTGVWAIDFADQYPACHVVGTDISPIQPPWVPPNLEFQIDDCNQEWTFEPESIDYVHMRYLLGSILDWDGLFQEAFKCCKPGGWVESLESAPWMMSDDGTVREDSALGQWGKIFVNGSKKIGRTFTVVDDDAQRKGMENAGFVDIQEFERKVPIGAWPRDPKLKEIGRFAQATIGHDPEGYVLYMASSEGWTEQEVRVYAAHLRKEMRNPNIHTYFRMKVVWGRKP